MTGFNTNSQNSKVKLALLTKDIWGFKMAVLNGRNRVLDRVESKI